MKKFLQIAGIVVGSILALGPVWGAIGTAVGMMHAFNTLGGAGISDPRALSADIGHTLTASAIGMIACPVGIILLTICLISRARSKREAPLPPLPASPPTA
jgi:biopolymer transport protein ExbB/TolQ